MPYAKRYRRRRYNRRQNKQSAGYKLQGYVPSLSQVQRASATASAAYAGMQILKGMINAEKKFHDTTVPVASIPAGADIDPTSVPTQMAIGDTDQDRTGSKLRVKSLQFKGELSWNSTSAQLQRVRILLVQMKNCDGDFMTLGDILADPTNIDSFYNVDESHDYRVLKDTKYLLSDQKPGHQFNLYVPMNDIVKYVGTTDAEASCGWGTLGIYVFGDNSTNLPGIIGNARIRYYDN